jgi:hypothetical protein
VPLETVRGIRENPSSPLSHDYEKREMVSMGKGIGDRLPLLHQNNCNDSSFYLINTAPDDQPEIFGQWLPTWESAN